MRRLVIGDIHGMYDRLQEVLDKAGFSDSDTLYSVGDFCDRGTQNLKTLQFLVSLDNFRPVIGNHDWWLYLWLRSQFNPSHWTFNEEDSLDCWKGWNGGQNTFRELKDQDKEFLKQVFEWLKPIPFIRKVDDKVIIHSIAPDKEYAWRNREEWKDLENITLENIQQFGLMYDIVYDSKLWNRDVIQACKDYQQIGYMYPTFKLWAKDLYSKEFQGNPVYIIGHTPLDHPFFDKELGIAGIDTGAFCSKANGWDVEGCLTLLDMDTFEYWQSGKDGVQVLKDKE